MKYAKQYARVIAIKEKAAGNEVAGTSWIETKSFLAEIPVKDIVDWAKDADGKLIITIDESSITGDYGDFM